MRDMTIPFVLGYFSVLLTHVVAPMPAYNANCYPVADVVFLVDGSDSISAEEFAEQRHFISRFVNESDIQPSKIRTGFVVVSSTIGDSLKLSNSWTKPEVLGRVSQMTQQQEGTRTDLGLVQMEQILMSEGRKDAIHIGVILTDGRAKYEKATRGEAGVVKNTGTFLIAVGVGRLINDRELKKIASTPGNAYRLRPVDLSVRLLEETVKFLGQEWCAVNAPRRTRKSSTTASVPVAESPSTYGVTSATVVTPTTTPTMSPWIQTTTVMSATSVPTSQLAATTSKPIIGANIDIVPRDKSPTLLPKTPKPTPFDVRNVIPLTTSLNRPISGMHAFKLFDIDVPLNVPFNYVKHKASVKPELVPWKDTSTSIKVDIHKPGPTKLTVDNSHFHDSRSEQEQSVKEPSKYILQQYGTKQCLKSRIVDGIGYTFHPKSCSEFLQCLYVGGKLQARTVSCPFLTVFDERYTVCRPYDQGSCWRGTLIWYAVNNICSPRAQSDQNLYYSNECYGVTV